MGRSSYQFFRNSNNNLFTVSGVSGYAHATDKYMADGVIVVNLSKLGKTEANAVIIKDFPYKFKIIGASYNHFAVATLAGGSVEIYNGTTSNATQYVCAISAEASRSFHVPPTINFNKSTVDTTDQLQVIVEGVSSTSCALMKGALTLYIVPAV